MGSDFHLFGLNIKGKLLDCVGVFLLGLKFDSAGHFVTVDDLYFFNNSFRIFRGDKSSKVKDSFIDKENV